MKLKYFLIIAIVASLVIGIVSCKNKGDNSESEENDSTATKVIEDKWDTTDKDEITFLQTFLDQYLQLSGKDATEFAKKHLTAEFYSKYIESSNNQDDPVDLICEVLTSEKVEKVDRIEKGSEAPESFIVQFVIKDSQGNEFTQQYDMTVVKEDGKFKLADSQIYD